MRPRALPLTGLVCGLAGAALLVFTAVLGQGDYLWALGWISFPAVGGLLLWRRPENRIGWLMVATGACFALGQLGTYVLRAQPNGSWPAVELAVEALSVGWLLMVATVVCFPSGRPVTRWDRTVLRGLVVGGAALLVAYGVSSEPMEATGQLNPWAVTALSGYARFLLGPGFGLVIVLLLAAVVGLALRWRRADPIERLQYRWLVLGAASTAIGLLLVNLSRGDRVSPVLAVLVVTVIMSPIPLAIGVAVTRYHLYDVDRVISRTSSYAIVTGMLLGTYAVIVTSVTRLLPDSSTLAVAAATLAAAALARPLYRRVQHAVDRRFNRARYDAERTVDDFGSRLRHEIRPEAVVDELMVAVRGTMQPEGVSVWVRQA